MWCCVAYLGCHFLLYVAVLRGSRRWRSERGIFRYHVLSAGFVTVAVVVLSLLSERIGVAVASIVIVVSLHGIYSLSFLELWSLAEGGYSLSILRQCALKGTLTELTGLLELRQLGESKAEARLTGLQRIGLVRKQSDLFVLSRNGRIAALGLRALRWIAAHSTWIDHKCG
jgi:hypothetical protein